MKPPTPFIQAFLGNLFHEGPSRDRITIFAFRKRKSSSDRYRRPRSRSNLRTRQASPLQNRVSPSIFRPAPSDRLYVDFRLVIEQERLEKEVVENVANFGYKSLRQCICEVQGQQPCPRIVSPPSQIRSIWRNNKVVN